MPTHDFKNIGEVLDFELLKGTIATLDSATDTCTVTVGGENLTALLFYHCAPDKVLRSNGAITGAAKGFDVDNEVIVLINSDKTVVKVIGHVSGITKCKESVSGNYYALYDTGVSQLNLDDTALVLKDVMLWEKIGVGTFTPRTINFQLKKFYHNVMTNGVIVERDLYFVSTNLYFPPEPFNGWKNFALSNPSFPLVSNNMSTKITMTAQVMADLREVNATINNENEYISEGSNDNWKIIDGTGDCEDFALGKAQALLDLGYPASALHIECAQIEDPDPELRTGHAWLVVQTTVGDYALDLNSDDVIKNNGLTFGDKKFIARRRQIGKNWAHISPFGCFSGMAPQIAGGQVFYILDPLLNVFHIIDKSVLHNYPFFSITSGTPPTYSETSFNFSTDNNSIYWAYAGSIRKYQLGENILNLKGTTSYTGLGYVGRGGTIEGPLGTYGIQNPSETINGGLIEVTIRSSNNLWHLTAIGSARQGNYKYLHNCDVISQDGYYEYVYYYPIGVQSVTRSGKHNEIETLLIKEDIDYGNVKEEFYACSVKTFSDPNEDGIYDVLASHVSAPMISYNKYPLNGAFIHKNTLQPVYGISENVQHLIWPVGHHYQAQDATDTLYIFGEELNFRTVVGHYPTPLAPTFDMFEYDGLYVWNWAHLEVSDTELIQGIYCRRDTDAGDNFGMVFKNGVSWLDDVAFVVGIAASNILGILYIPETDRLNN